MRMYERFWYRAAALTTACATVISAAYAATEVPMAARTIELLLDMPARPASAAARTGNTELVATSATVATANTAERASSATELPAAKADASGGSPVPDASPLRRGISDASDIAGPASTRDQTPGGDADNTQLLLLPNGTDAAEPRLIDSAAEDSWIRSASNFLREYRVAVMVAAASVFGLAGLLSVLAKRNSTTALPRHSMAQRHADKALKPQRTRIRIRFRIGERRHEHSHEHGQERDNNHVKREHRRRRRHSRRTAS